VPGSIVIAAMPDPPEVVVSTVGPGGEAS
jgi:hypothetical protein